MILVGTFTGTLTFRRITLDAGSGRDVFVVRALLDGFPNWAVQGGGTRDVADLLSAVVTANGDVVIAVEYEGTFQMTDGDQMTRGETVTAVGATDIALARVSSAGHVMWTKTFGGAGQDRPRAVAVGRGGEIALTGEFNGVAGFGGEMFTSAGFIDSFVAKYTGDGDHLWSRASGSAAIDRGLGVAVDASGAVYYTGSFHNTVELGGEPLTAAGSDFNGVLVKYDR